jgi:hypothetical protein
MTWLKDASTAWPTRVTLSVNACRVTSVALEALVSNGVWKASANMVGPFFHVQKV